MRHLPSDRCHPSCRGRRLDRKSTRLNSSHLVISYAVFCLKKKKTHLYIITTRTPVQYSFTIAPMISYLESTTRVVHPIRCTLRMRCSTRTFSSIGALVTTT